MVYLLYFIYLLRKKRFRKQKSSNEIRFVQIWNHTSTIHYKKKLKTKLKIYI